MSLAKPRDDEELVVSFLVEGGGDYYGPLSAGRPDGRSVALFHRLKESSP